MIRINRQSTFSYVCNACGRCCHNQVITLSPYDLRRIARAAGISSASARARFTIKRGLMLRFRDDGACAALDGVRCGIHPGRPLACRLYPLGLERGEGEAGERFVRLAPASRSAGEYGNKSTVHDFLEQQGAPGYLAMIDRYRPLIARFRARVLELVDFEQVEPREFWRRAIREALAESGYDENPIIEALFDPNCDNPSDDDAVAAHIEVLSLMISQTDDAAAVAAAGIMLAISLGYSAREVGTA